MNTPLGESARTKCRLDGVDTLHAEPRGRIPLDATFRIRILVSRMPFVVLSAPSIAGLDGEEMEIYASGLRERGFLVDVVPDGVAALRMVAMAGGRVDALVAIDQEQIAAGSFRSVVSPEAHLRLESVVKNVRAIDERLAYRGGIRARATPVVAVTRGGELEFEDRWTVSCTLPSPYDYDLRILAAAIERAIREWREGLLSELNYVGYVVTQDEAGRFDVRTALTRKKLRESEILTDAATPDGLRQNQFLVLGADLLGEFAAYQELSAALNSYEVVAKVERIKPETVFQRLFEKYPHLIYRNRFDAHFAKPAFRDPRTGKLIQPDFVLAPQVRREHGPAWEILDLKLPRETLLTSRRFHPDFSQKVHHAIRQLNNYRKTLAREDMRDEIVQRLGFQPLNARAAVLIGRRREEDDEVLSSLNDPVNNVELITYDDILDFEVSRLWTIARLALH